MNNYDVVVIGAGAVGVNVTYQLCKKGISVALVDRFDVAGGSSSRCSASILICDKTPGEDTAMGYASMMITKEIQEHCDNSFEFAQKGSLYVCETEEELAEAAGYVKKQQADGYDMKMVKPEEIADMEPYLARDIMGGIWTTPDATVNPYSMCFSIAEECRKMGADIYAPCLVTDVVCDETGAIEKVVTDKGELVTEKVVNCAGVWAPELGRMIGIDIPIKPRKGLMLVSERSFPIAHQLVHEFGYMLSKFENIDFERRVSERVERNNVAFELEPMEAGNFIMGGHRAFVGLDFKSEIEVMQAVAERGIRFFPVIKEMNCIRSYCGVRPWTEEHMPFICGVSEVPGYYIAAGHEGDGIALSGITGKLMMQLITGEKTDFEMAQFDLKRSRC